MKILYFGCVLMGFTSLALSKRPTPEIIQGNVKEHGWDGPIPIDPKTGLLHPPSKSFLLNVEDLTNWGPHANKYCKILDSGSFLHERYWKNYCTKKQNGEKIDVCCSGYECTNYGFGGGYWCRRLPREKK